VLFRSFIEAGAPIGALAEAAALESGRDLPESVRGGDEELEAAQEKLAQTKADTSEFDALVAKEIEGLPEDEGRTRMIHLDENIKITAKNTKKTVPMFKNFVAPYFHPYTNSKGEQKQGYWKTFLAWEEAQYPPKEPGSQQPEDTKSAQSFEDRKKAVTMECLKKIIPPADLNLEKLTDISPENIDDIEAKVSAWEPKKK
jgi:hypothetical protein